MNKVFKTVRRHGTVVVCAENTRSHALEGMKTATLVAAVSAALSMGGGSMGRCLSGSMGWA